ncbi:hypothetical protein BHE90_005805 [Fusarium euwallaceae]|uniref:Uncharacterized protein n=1 Tax=Fusarium euwallaceae TaxID=1147111 RepID=A0A430LVG4_9HYPO|nr:hypothetical protein BHE90_005805 [Fusarium euwallaceae]
MVSNKLMAVASAAPVSLAVVDAGVCILHGTTAISSALATETSSMATATSTSGTIETGLTTTSGTVSAEASSAATETSSGTTSVETTSATTSTIETSSATTSAQTTSITAKVTPTSLITNPEFDAGLQPWQAIPYPDQSLSLTTSSYKASKAAHLHFSSKSGSPFTNYLHHHIDKSLLKAGSYALEGFVNVNSPGDEGECCTRGCRRLSCWSYRRDGGYTQCWCVAGDSCGESVGKDFEVCEVTEEKLEEIDDFGVAVGFECFNADAYLDSVSFKAVEVEIE